MKKLCSTKLIYPFGALPRDIDDTVVSMYKIPIADYHVIDNYGCYPDAVSAYVCGVSLNNSKNKSLESLVTISYFQQ